MKNEFKKMWNNGISTVFNLFILLVLFSSSRCGSSQKANKTVLVQFQVTQSVPHCGGARPDPEQTYPTIQPVISETYVVFRSNDLRGKVCGQFTTSEEGEATISLPTGEYVVYQIDKTLPFEEFVAKKSSLKDTHYQTKEEGCFRNWYQEADARFKVGDEVIKINYSFKCFVGTHPCLEYSGPYPP